MEALLKSVTKVVPARAYSAAKLLLSTLLYLKKNTLCFMIETSN
nr:MAG TPA: hypothetical protein [Caudoviricetes sp.]